MAMFPHFASWFTPSFDWRRSEQNSSDPEQHAPLVFEQLTIPLEWEANRPLSFAQTVALHLFFSLMASLLTEGQEAARAIDTFIKVDGGTIVSDLVSSSSVTSDFLRFRFCHLVSTAVDMKHVALIKHLAKRDMVALLMSFTHPKLRPNVSHLLSDLGSDPMFMKVLGKGDVQGVAPSLWRRVTRERDHARKLIELHALLSQLQSSPKSADEMADPSVRYGRVFRCCTLEATSLWSFT
jgi:hypothetical protein